MQWEKGDILRGRKGSDAVHPIIFLEGHDDSYFIGAMITSSSEFEDNVPMTKEHFEILDPDGKKYQLYYKDSYLVEAKLLKRQEWRPFKKVGHLTVVGIDFVESKMSAKYPIVWEEYLGNKMS